VRVESSWEISMPIQVRCADLHIVFAAKEEIVPESLRKNDLIDSAIQLA
jgi:hypothetical protein